MAPLHAVVIGSVNADLVVEVPRTPLVGQTLRAAGARRSAGGKGANQAVALARGPGTVVVTLGAGGALLARGGGPEPARSTRAFTQ